MIQRIVLIYLFDTCVVVDLK